MTAADRGAVVAARIAEQAAATRELTANCAHPFTAGGMCILCGRLGGLVTVRHRA